MKHILSKQIRLNSQTSQNGLKPSFSAGLTRQLSRLCLGLSMGLSLSLGLLACQPAPDSLRLAPQERLQAPSGVSYQAKITPYARLQTVGLPKGQTQNLRLTLTYPQSHPNKGFSTQAFGCSEVAFARVWVEGSSLTAPLYADGSNSQQFIPVSGCDVSATLSNVPFGNLVVSIQLYDAQEQLLTGSELKGATRLGLSSQNLELSYRQMPAGRILETLLKGTVEERFLAGKLDLNALQSLLDSLMVVSNSFPAYSFTNHPSLIHTALLLSHIKAQHGDLSTLTPDSQYLQTAGSVSLNLNGYLLNQAVSLSIDDALSPNATATANGQVIINQVPPGNWQLRLSGPGYLSRQVPITVLANQQSDLNTLSIYPPQATLTGISPASGSWGTQVTLTGTHFNPTLANNLVSFGSTAATVTSASQTQLLVTVPDHLALGAQPITVTIGAANPAGGQNFNVLVPAITSLSGPTGSTGDQITLTGTGFSNTLANNSVSFGGTAGTVISATPTQLVVTVPEQAAGSAPLVVSVNGQSSPTTAFTILPRLSSLSTGQVLGGKAALIRGQTLTLTGNNFSQTASQNIVQLGAISLPAQTASATSLTLTLPASLTSPGDLSVRVVSNGQSSLNLTAVVPSINIDFSGGF